MYESDVSGNASLNEFLKFCQRLEPGTSLESVNTSLFGAIGLFDVLTVMPEALFESASDIFLSFQQC